MLTIACASWNIHRGIGRDGLCRPDRIRQTLREEVVRRPTDILALQEADEVEHPFAGFLDLDGIAADLGLVSAHAKESMRWGAYSQGFHGLIVLLAPDITIHHGHVIDLPGHCHRGAVVLELSRNAKMFRVVATHLSRLQALRLAQMRTVGQYMARRPAMQTILIGDCNDWRFWHGTAFSRRIVGTTLRGPRLATFPVARPFLPLDRIMTDAPGRVRDAQVLDGPLIRAASDHRPLRAIVEVGR